LDLQEVLPPVARSISDAKRSGNEIAMTLGPLIGLPQVQEVFRIVTANHMEMRLREYDNTPYEKSRMALVRCLAPKREVNNSVRLEDLDVLSSNGKDLIVFKEVVSGLTDSQVCSATERGFVGTPGDTLRVDSLQFEVFGPVHYLIRGHLDDAVWNDELRSATIVSITPAGDGTLKFALSAEAGGRKTPHFFVFTTTWDGKRLAVSEMGKSFTRCRVTSIFGRSEPAPLP
jgi:hypothetical protein